MSEQDKTDQNPHTMRPKWWAVKKMKYVGLELSQNLDARRFKDSELIAFLSDFAMANKSDFLKYVKEHDKEIQKLASDEE